MKDQQKSELLKGSKLHSKRWRDKNRKHIAEQSREYRRTNPWVKTIILIRGRCRNKNHSCGRRGIKNYLKTPDLKMLWLRDKAYLLDQPSIDRIDGGKDYTIENCRYIEFYDNLHRGKRPIQQLTLDGKEVRIWGGANEAARALGCWAQNIRSACQGAYKTAQGYKWEYYKGEDGFIKALLASKGSLLIKVKEEKK